MDKMVEIARFQYPADAQTLVALLKSEGIDCYIRNEITAQVLSSMDVGGARVEILESELSHAIEVMKASGYEISEEDEGPDQIQTVSAWTRHIPFLRNYSLGVQILIFFLIIAVCLGLLIFFASPNFSQLP